jgi:sulfur-carrier protein
MVKVLFFATLKDKTGTRQAEFDLPAGLTVAQLKIMMVEEFPNLKGFLDHCITAVDHNYQSDEHAIPVQAEVAFFPPVSGG